MLGVEAPLWSETLRTLADIEYMAFPGCPPSPSSAGPAATHDWDSFRTRLGAQAPRWRCSRIDFYRSPQVPWT